MFEMREFIRGIEWDKIEEVFGVGFCGRMQSRMIERFLQVGEPAKIVEFVQALGVPLELNADGLPALEKLTLEQLVQIRDGAQ